MSSTQVHLIKNALIEAQVCYLLKWCSRKRNTANPVANWQGDIERLRRSRLHSVPASLRRRPRRSLQAWPPRANCQHSTLYQLHHKHDDPPITQGCFDTLLSFKTKREGRAVHHNKRREFRRRMNTKSLSITSL